MPPTLVCLADGYPQRPENEIHIKAIITVSEATPENFWKLIELGK